MAVEWIDAASVDGLAVDDVLGAAFGPKDGTADPAAVARELVRRAAELGVEVRPNTGAAQLAPQADTVVIACGPWSAALGAQLGVELPVRPLCRQLLLTSPRRLCPTGCRSWSSARRASTSAAAARGSCSR